MCSFYCRHCGGDPCSHVCDGCCDQRIPYDVIRLVPTGITGPIGPTGPTGATGADAVITPAAAVADLPATATLDEAIVSFNELLASLRAAGFLAT